MDKNMIHIDDLVRQRLGGGEEQEMPGSWLRMRDLLDKEMPEKKRPAAGYYNWRRMLGIMSGLVLLSALTVGGYKAIFTRFNKSEEKLIATTTNSNTPAYARKEHNNVASATPQKILNKANNDKTLAASNNTVKSTIPTINSKKRENVTISKQNTSATVGYKSGNNLSATSSTSDEMVAHKKSLNKERLTAAKNVSEDKNKTESSKSATNQIVCNQVLHGISKSAASAEKTNTRDITSSSQPVQDLIVASGADNTRSKMPAPLQPERVKDTLNKLTIIQRLTINPLTREGKLSADTISIERLAFERYRSTATTNTIAGEALCAINPASSRPEIVHADAEINNSLVSLSNNKVRSHKTNRWNARSFDEVVRDVKFNLAQTKFYPGFSGGGNSYLFGPNNIAGFQLGLFGLFTFGETWGAMAELKYIHRFNGGATLKDNYVDIKPASTGGYMKANVERFFKYTSLQSIEMPLAIRYAAGRLNIFGGVNMAYHFAVNAEEVTLLPHYSAYTITTDPNVQKDRPGIYYHDFRSRFALGGMLGVSYEISPAIQLDLRATKHMWDNAYGLGAEQVSHQLYSAPSFQFSIFYRFSQRNQIPKAK